MISQETIDEVRYRMDIYEVISKHVTLKREGFSYKGKCPFHKENTPSFSVSKEKQIYKCFGCGAGGDAIEFVQKIHNYAFIDAIKYIANIYLIEVQEDKPQPKQKPIKSNIPVSDPLYDWFKSRGIEKETVDKFGITLSKEWMPKAQEETDALCFNYYRKGELINVKYRAKNKDFKLAKNAELIFYNLDSINDKDFVIITEGEIDCMTVSQCGFTNVISVPNGAAKGNQRLEYLDNCWEAFNGKTQVVLFVDNDEPGNALREELARRIGKERCCIVSYPPECKDANNVLLKHGKQAIIDCLSNAKEYPIEGIISMNDMMEDVSEFYLNGYPKGVRVGIERFDDHISFMPGQFTTITGIPGSGKSEFTDNIMCKLSLNHDWQFAVCSFENQPASLHATKLMEKLVKKSFAFRVNPVERMDINEFNTAAALVQRHFHFININKVEVTLKGILEKAKELVERKGINGLLIDPWNYIEHKVNPGQTETQYISECLTMLKAFALTQGIHIFLIAHPTKLRKENNKYEVPTMYSISGSAHFFNKTDNGLSIYRDFVTNEVEIHIQKIRYSWLGKIGMISFNYNTYTRQYELLDK